MCLVDIAASPYGPLLLPHVSPLSIYPDSHTAKASLHHASLSFYFKSRGDNWQTMSALTAPAIDNHALVWQIPRHFTDQRLSQNWLWGEEEAEEGREGKKASGLTKRSLSMPRAWAYD